MERLLGIAETAKILSVAKSTLYSWVSQRKISYIKVGRLVKFDMDDILEFIERNKVSRDPTWNR